MYYWATWSLWVWLWARLYDSGARLPLGSGPRSASALAAGAALLVGSRAVDYCEGLNNH